MQLIRIPAVKKHMPRVQATHAVRNDINFFGSSLFQNADDIFPEFRGPSFDTCRPADIRMVDLKFMIPELGAKALKIV